MKLIFAYRQKNATWQLFTKPDSALLNGNKPFFLPDFAQQFSAQLLLTVRICKMGHSIQPRFAHRYYDAVGVGLDITADDLMEDAITKGLPWTRAKGFDGSAVVNQWLAPDRLQGPAQLLINDSEKGTIRYDETAGIDQLIAEVSQYFTLRTGDIIFFSPAASVTHQLTVDDQLTALLDGEELINMRIK